MSLQRYYELFTNAVDVAEEVRIIIVDEALINRVANVNGQANVPNDADRDKARGMTLALRFIRGTNTLHPKPYLTHLRNSYLDGYGIYPPTHQEAHNVMRRQQDPNMGGAHVHHGDGMAFAQEVEGSEEPRGPGLPPMPGL